MRRILPFLAAAALVLLTGAVHGIWTGRWVVSQELKESAALLQNVPMTIGDWKGEDLKIDPYEREAGQIEGYVKRRYANVKDGTALSMLIVSGRSGPISVHTPDICFTSAGFQLVGPQTRIPVSYEPGPKNADFWWGDFSRMQVATPTNLRVFWSWNGGGAWRAPEYPRWAHASYRVIYKLYVTRETPSRLGKLDGDVALPFIKVILPEIDRALAAAPAADRQG